MNDKDIRGLIEDENTRQNRGLELIASENYASRDVREACGSILTNKYAEGYPGKRYYGGCENIDRIEQIAINRACKLFNCKYANVQPHSGSQANMAAYSALLDFGDTILAPEINSGGHLTHSSPVSFVSKLYHVVTYKVNPQTGKLNYEEIKKLALSCHPKLILTGFSAYPYNINYSIFRDIANEVSAYLMVDMAHIAGLVAAKKCMNPCEYADIVTSTTHKTLRGPRGGLILTNDPKISKAVDSAVFPKTQGGPFEHIIAAKAICFGEASTPEFKKYINQVIINTYACADQLAQNGCTVSSTDNHLFLLNTIKSFSLTGRLAENMLGKIGITVNKNILPGDKQKISETSGIRVGMAALTTRGLTEQGARNIGNLIYLYLTNKIDEDTAKNMVKKITKKLKPIERI